MAYLRKHKFNVPKTFEALETYLMYSQFYPQWLENIDIMSHDMQEFFDSGVMYPLPSRDKYDRQVFMIVLKNFDCDKFNFDDFVRAAVSIFLYLTNIEVNQVTGMTCVLICDQLSLGFVKLFNFSNIIHSLRQLWYGTGVRLKGFFFVNMPLIGVATVEVIRQLASEKMRDRIHVLGSNELSDYIDVNILPKEYGGELSEADILIDFKIQFYKQREFILETSNSHITDFESLKIDNTDYLVPGSFRSLEID